jgi:hypothetical protein
MRMHLVFLDERFFVSALVDFGCEFLSFARYAFLCMVMQAIWPRLAGPKSSMARRDIAF